MRKKKCKKILRSGCFLVACCVILAGAAAPLTAYAAEDDGSSGLDVAQETRTLSGTWRWNDEIDFSAISTMVEIPFEIMVFPVFDVDSESGLVVELNAPVYYESLVLRPADPSSSNPIAGIAYSETSLDPVYTMPSVIPPDVSPEELQYMGWNTLAGMVLAFESLRGNEISNIDVLFGWGQTFTFVRPQEVSVEFYDWFAANAVKQEMPGDNLLETIFSAIRAPLSWVGSVLGALISGPMSELLPLFAVFIAISLIFVVVVLVKKSIWGG